MLHMYILFRISLFNKEEAEKRDFCTVYRYVSLSCISYIFQLAIVPALSCRCMHTLAYLNW